MADKSFGVKELNIVGDGDPSISSPTNLDLNAVNVAISTNITIGGEVKSDLIVGTGYSVTAPNFYGDGSGLTNLPSGGGGGGISNIVEDTTPQLGGNLDVNNYNITGTGNVSLTGSVTATSFSGDIVSATWTLGASGASHYTFTGPGFTSAENDPEIYLVRGQTYKFVNNSGGSHPFRIQSTPNGSAGTQYNDGITNNDTSTGTLTWDVQFDAPSKLYYQCVNHGGMGGVIHILDGSSTGLPQNAQTSAYTLVASDAGKHISITTGGVTLNSGVFNIGDTVTVYNDSSNTQMINAAAGVTMRRISIGDLGSRGLNQYGLATIMCIRNNEYVISGAGLT